MNKENKKGCVYLGGSDAAHKIALNKAISPNTSLKASKELPTELKRVGGGYLAQALIRLVYINPLINTHEIHAQLGISNSHDISKKLSKRLAKAGYTFEKLSLNGTKKPYCWQLRRCAHE